VASPDPLLHLVAGPNGAGKTTLAARVIAPVTHLPFVNADVIAAERWPLAQAEHAYDASQVAAQVRQELIAARSSFISETVFSHPSKLVLIHDAQDAGYHVTLHVVLVPEDTTVARVHDILQNFDAVVLEAGERFGRAHPHQSIGVAHGFYTLTDCTLTYIVNNYYNGRDEFGVAWNDAALGLDWGIESATLSPRDMGNPSLNEIPVLSLPR